MPDDLRREEAGMDDDQSGTSLADRLNLLFETIHPADRGPLTNKEVAAAVRERGGSISDVYLWQLRTGRRDNPSRQCLQELADFFEIDPAYFFDDRRAEDILRDLHALRAMRDLRVRAVAARLGELAVDDPAALAEILDRVLHAWDTRRQTPARTDHERPIEDP